MGTLTEWGPPGELSEVVLGDLDRAGVTDTSWRWVCLRLAHCIDGAPLTASGLSVMVKQLRTAMDKALASRGEAS